jgi:hypothetical protein
MFYNTYEIERFGIGKLARFAFVSEGRAEDVLQLYFPLESLRDLRAQNEKYLRSLPDPALTRPPFPNVVRQPPIFVNHILLAHTAEHGELGLNTIRVHEVAEAVNNKEKRDTPLIALPAALLHAQLPLHSLFCLELFEGAGK